jgi:hypothetical protein
MIMLIITITIMIVLISAITRSINDTSSTTQTGLSKNNYSIKNLSSHRSFLSN